MKILSWDSEFFNFTVASISLQQALHIDDIKAEMTLHNIRLLYILHDLDIPIDNHLKNTLITTSGAVKVDTKVIYSKQLTHTTPTALLQGIIPFDKNNATNALYRLAIQSGEYSRFRRDKNFPEGSFEKMYRIWVNNSLDGIMGDKVFVAKDTSGNTAGMVTLTLKEPAASVGLIAVDESSRGQQTGRKLMAAAEATASLAGKSTLTVATQLDNTGACRFYESLGYGVVKRVEYYHLWR